MYDTICLLERPQRFFDAPSSPSSWDCPRAREVKVRWVVDPTFPDPLRIDIFDDCVGAKEVLRIVDVVWDKCGRPLLESGHAMVRIGRPGRWWKIVYVPLRKRQSTALGETPPAAEGAG